MSKYEGTIRIGGPRGNSHAEFDAAIAAYRDLGFKQPNDLTQTAFLVGAGEPFFEAELAPDEMLMKEMPDVGIATKRYFLNEVRPELNRQVRRGGDKIDNFAFIMGRFAASATRRGLMVSEKDSLEVTETAIRGHGEAIPVVLGDPGRYVVDFGMGMIGLATHVKNARAEKYSVIGIQKDRANRIALEGMASYERVNDGQVVVLDGGITAGVETLKVNGYNDNVDVVLASRIHGAGNDLRVGLKASPSLVRPQTGVIVGRGPREYHPGVGYNEIRKTLFSLPGMETILDATFVKRWHGERPEANRLVAVRKV